MGRQGWEGLPALKDVPSFDAQCDLFIHKLSLCHERINFNLPNGHLKRESLKTQTLEELIDYMDQPMKDAFPMRIYPPLISMVSANLFRRVPTREGLVNYSEPDDQSRSLEPAWVHVELVYGVLQRFIAHPRADVFLMQTVVTKDFILRLLDLFDSEDMREREQLKTILHSAYSRIIPLRGFIRSSITDLFQRYIYELQRFNGVAELLEILGSIINGFALPLRDEHKEFLRTALIPLHVPAGLATYHVQLSFCITLFVEKDTSLSIDVIKGLCKYWPRVQSRKEVLFLAELEELLELVEVEELSSVVEPLFGRIAGSIASQHFQVAERALLLWNNEYVVNCIMHYREVAMPAIIPALRDNERRHWNQQVVLLSCHVQRLLSEMDPQLYDRCFNEDERSLMRRERVARLKAKLSEDLNLTSESEWNGTIRPMSSISELLEIARTSSEYRSKENGVDLNCTELKRQLPKADGEDDDDEEVR
ncbi:hypothetical protein NDN08_006354 [Rhodosorus marinus]|uniref:Serine/threonine protein phosphatase 2A regulatory subunit n=1 Tax=Rhodosorus marinus TaxID=101924 RepID=A0AAV8ULY9_9RHOD|nr:hypothetical protein NDN08_006354 [Rhodosorus marinus]